MPADSKKLNSVEELKKGTIKTPSDNTSGEYTILFVGETGTGKTSLLSLLSNVLSGHTPDKYAFAHDKSNEAGGSENHSQTESPKLYEFKSKNGIRFHILDTPGLADTRGINQDAKHKAAIVQAVTSQITTVNAIVIVANGTLPRLGVATDYALWSLSSMFPRTLDKSIAIFLTNVPNALGCNFTQDALPEALRGDNYHPFFIDNPVALWKRYNEIQERKEDVDPDEMDEMKTEVERSHKRVLKELLKFFNWVVDLKSQPTNDIQTLYDKSQQVERSIAEALSRATQLEAKKKELRELAVGSTVDVQKFERAITKTVWVHSPTDYHNTLCQHAGCYSNCHERCYLDFSLEPETFLGCMAMGDDQQCVECKHSYLDHRHYNAMWKQEDRTEIVVHEKKQFDTKSEEGKQKEMKAKLEKAIARLDDDLKKSLDEVATHSAAYSQLALTRSFTALIERTIRLLETTAEAMRNNNSDLDSVKAVEENLEVVKAKLKLVINAAKSA
jgi:energy-coupling factor transporter ATP-binding protein EcfA2